MHAPPRRVGMAVAALIACAAVTVPGLLGSSGPSGAPDAADAAEVQRAPAVSARRPNVVIVTTDDMRADDLRQMRRTRRLLGRMNLTDFVSNHPLCCPARAELLTGQLGQRNGVHANTGRWGGYGVLRGKDNTLGRWFLRSGYSTAVVGKFVNGWCPGVHRRPDGWTDFTALVRNAYSPYHYSYSDGSRTRAAPRGVHTNDFVTRRTLARIREYSSRPRPFLVWSSFIAPHDMEVDGVFVPPVPAPRHQGDLSGVVPVSESKPSYQEPSPRDVARAAAQDAVTCGEEGQATLDSSRVAAASATIRQLNQRRLESLLSVDEGVARMVRTLQRLGELRRTVFVFTSDNGYLLGEHGLVGKNSYYEESLRVPLRARGPGVAAGASEKGSMITDIAPSLARLARVDPRRRIDGRRDMFAAGPGWGRLLIQTGDEVGPWLWRGVRTARWSYVETRDDRVLLYDREADPFQLHNVATIEPEVVRRLRSALESMTR